MGFDTQTMRVGPYRANGREIKGDRARFAQCPFKNHKFPVQTRLGPSGGDHARHPGFWNRFPELWPFRCRTE